MAEVATNGEASHDDYKLANSSNEPKDFTRFNHIHGFNASEKAILTDDIGLEIARKYIL
jgi:hypothetical protein